MRIEQIITFKNTRNINILNLSLHGLIYSTKIIFDFCIMILSNISKEKCWNDLNLFLLFYNALHKCSICCRSCIFKFIKYNV